MCNGYAGCHLLHEMEHVDPAKVVGESCGGRGPRRVCEALCEKRSCCWEEGPGNCFDDNRVWCGEFDACQRLGAEAEAGEETWEVAVDVPPDCTEVDTMVEVAFDLCQAACLPSVCCFTGEECYSGPFVDCEKYENCRDFINFATSQDGYEPPAVYQEPHEVEISSTVENNLVLAIPADTVVDLKHICSQENVASNKGKSECQELCNQGVCCITDASTCSNIVIHEALCRDYHVCQILQQVSHRQKL